MNRQLLTLVAYLVVAVALVVLMRWLRNRASLEARSPGPGVAAGPPLRGTSVPLPGLLEPHRAMLERLLEPALRLQPGGEPVARLGGEPRLPAEIPWPKSPTHAMSFVGELDLAALARIAPDAAPALPRDGRLLFFYDVEEMRWGFEPTDGAFFRLIRVEGAGQAQTAPVGATVFKERVLGATRVHVLPDAEQVPDSAAFSDPVAEAFFEHASALAPEPDHRVGGHAAWIQGDDREGAAIAAVGGSSGTPEQARAARVKLAPDAAAQWRLLWQVDSDDVAGFMWGDVGRLYLLARDADLRAGRFDRVWLVLQCY